MNWDKILTHFGFNWSIKNIFYRMDWTTLNPSSVKEYLRRNVYLARFSPIYHDIPTYRYKNYDQRMIMAFRYVVKNIKYQRDIDKFGVKEKFEDIDNILETKKADCESMATLLFCIARKNKINPLKIKFICGYVKTSKGKGGHSWIEYQADEDNEWYIFDPAYDPHDDAIIRFRIKAKDDARYLSKWFECTDI